MPLSQTSEPERPTRCAAILVAGVGSRLRPLTDDRPKALVEVEGKSILLRAVESLRNYGVTKLVLATGYRSDAIEGALGRLNVEAILCPNPRYDSTQNSVSLALCAHALRGESFFKLDGDLVFDSSILARLDAVATDLAVAVDTKRRLDAEAMKVSVAAGGRIKAFGKHLTIGASAGESIGIERIAARASGELFLALEREIGSGRTDRYYEDVYSDLIGAGKIDATLVEAGDLPWTEIDTPEDLAAARRLVSGAAHTD